MTRTFWIAALVVAEGVFRTREAWRKSAALYDLMWRRS